MKFLSGWPRIFCQCHQTLLTRSGNVIYPQLRLLGLGLRLSLTHKLFMVEVLGITSMNGNPKPRPVKYVTSVKHGNSSCNLPCSTKRRDTCMLSCSLCQASVVSSASTLKNLAHLTRCTNDCTMCRPMQEISSFCMVFLRC